MYTLTNFRTKKELREAFSEGRTIGVFQPGPFPGKVNGTIALEGPHYPEPHRWYASVEIKNSVVVRIIS